MTAVADETCEDSNTGFLLYKLAEADALLADAKARIGKLEEALRSIRDADYRGNRCRCSGVALNALKETE